ncbi:hypothetical protein [Flavobacterium sp.]|uniref:hypothetical protein n=1 Tax=Flavobacterium sp. TaxID=239 RepID=UPI0035292A19
MSKVKRIFEITGTFDGFNFYTLNGKPVVRKSGGGFNGEAIKTKASMEKVRQNGTEFGRVSGWVKRFKVAIGPLLFSNRFSDLHSRLVSLFMKIKNADTNSERGMRDFVKGLPTNTGRQLMTGFSIPTYSKHWKHLYAQTTFDWATSALHLQTKSGHPLLLPKGVNAFSIQAGILQWGGEERESVLTLSDRVLVTEVAHLPKFLVVPMTSPIEVGSLAIVSIEHYERIAGEYRPVASKEGMYLEVIGVSG